MENYDLYLKYDAQMGIGLHGYWADLCEDVWADIMYWTDTTDTYINNEEDKGIKIGTLDWITYNQALAMAHELNMTNVQYLAMLKGNITALLDLDYTSIDQKTIDQIGAASNPNIVTIIHFAIEAAWRNKRLGEEVLKGFIEQMLGKCGYIVIVDNVPAQFDEYYSCAPQDTQQRMALDSLEKDPEKAQWKLNAFWQRCGFKQFKNYRNVFICNVEKTVPELIKSREPAI